MLLRSGAAYREWRRREMLVFLERFNRRRVIVAIADISIDARLPGRQQLRVPAADAATLPELRRGRKAIAWPRQREYGMKKPLLGRKRQRARKAGQIAA